MQLALFLWRKDAYSVNYCQCRTFWARLNACESVRGSAICASTVWFCYRKNWKAIPGKQIQSMVKNRTEVCSAPILRFDPCSSCIAWLCEASRCLRGCWRCWQRMSSAAGLRQQHQRNQRLGLARRRLGFASPDEELHKKRETFLGKDVRSKSQDL